jgi:Ferritin-like
MPTPTELRDLSWVRGALQAAIALEHSTMPPYTAAMYSLEVQNYPSYNTIRSVLMEEMLHMAALSNMLASIGGSPRIRDLDPGYPRTGLPGKVVPDLEVVLAPLSPRQLDNFMRLEAPPELLAAAQRSAVYPTIDDFYETLREAIVRNGDAIRSAVRTGGPANQVGGNLGYRTMVPERAGDAVEEFLSAIDMITQQGQGEGEGSLKAGPASQGETSHYARFAELRYRARYAPPASPVELSRETVRGQFTGDEVVWPVVINTLAVPEDGYDRILAEDPDAPSIRKELEAFDAAYTAMMTALDHAWNGPAATSWPSLGEAVIQMNEMRVLSCFNIARHQVPDDVVERLPQLYPGEHRLMSAYTDLSAPVFYGPRFRNLAARS